MLDDLLTLLTEASGPVGERPAILAPGRLPLPHAVLVEQIRHAAAALSARGVTRGDRVAISLPGGPEAVVAFLAAATAGAAAPLNPAYRERELEFFLEDLAARVLLVATDDDGPAPVVAARLGIPVLRVQVPPGGAAGVFDIEGPAAGDPAPDERPEPGDVALVLHTSGTTSRPKIVPLTHGNLCASARNIRTTLNLVPDDRCLNVMPLFHIHGLVAAVLASLSAGASLVATPGFLATRFFRWLAEFRPTWYTAVPTMHQAILSRADAERETIGAHPLRFLRSSSASLPPRVLAELEAAFGAPVVEAYGMTEAAHQMASNPLPPAQRKPGSVGPAAGPEVAVMDDGGRLLGPGEIGEVVIRGENVFAAYASNPDANEHAFTDGWFRTGDLGRLDEDGYLFLAGRSKEIINRGGEKISPREIDEVLLDHPGVAQAVAFAMPHPTLGEDIGAAVVPVPGAPPSAEDLLAFAAERLADFKLPRRFVFLAEIPKGPTGKLRRIGLFERLGLDRSDADLDTQSRLPTTETERRLAVLWEQVLETAGIAPADDFFGCGGDSLLAAVLTVRVREEFGVAMPQWVVLARPGVRAMAAWVDEAPRATAAVTARAPAPGEPGPLSPEQSALWVRERLAPGLPIDHRPLAVRITGVLDRDALGRALTGLVRRHPVLGATFPVREGRPVQVEAAAAPVVPELVDLTSIPPAAREDALAARFREEARRTFDLESGPLLRAHLLVLAPEEHVLLLGLHHIVFDGWSAAVAVRELAALHAAARDAIHDERHDPLPPLRLRYAAHAAARAAWADGPNARDGLSFFRERLQGAPRLVLPGRDPESLQESVLTGQVETARADGALGGRVRARAREARTTPFAVLLAAFLMSLRDVTGEHDLLVGIPHHGRTRSDLEGLIGLFARTVPMRTDLRGAETSTEVLERTAESLRETLPHADVPFPAIVRELRPPVRPGRNPLLEVAFQLRNLPPAAAEFGGTRFAAQHVEAGIAGMDLCVEVADTSDGGLLARFVYPAARFDRETVRGWADRWVGALGEVADHR